MPMTTTTTMTAQINHNSNGGNTKMHLPTGQSPRHPTQTRQRKQNDDQQLEVSRNHVLGANSPFRSLNPTMDGRITTQPQCNSTRPTDRPMTHPHVELQYDYCTHSARPPGEEWLCQPGPHKKPLMFVCSPAYGTMQPLNAANSHLLLYSLGE